jgi:hypothetical protein
LYQYLQNATLNTHRAKNEKHLKLFPLQTHNSEDVLNLHLFICLSFIYQCCQQPQITVHLVSNELEVMLKEDVVGKTEALFWNSPEGTEWGVGENQGSCCLGQNLNLEPLKQEAGVLSI